MKRFLVAELIWAAGILVPMVAVGLLDNDPMTAERIIRWMARAVAIAAYPAGIAVAPLVFDGSMSWRQVGAAFAGACVVGLVVFALNAFVAPLASDTPHSLGDLAGAMRNVNESWETRNHAGWTYYMTFLTALNAVLYGVIGAQVGYWVRYAVPHAFQRPLYWAIGLGFLVTGFAIHDSTYETIVLHTNADAGFAAAFTVLIPAFVCAGLGLPTLAALRQTIIPERTVPAAETHARL